MSLLPRKGGADTTAQNRFYHTMLYLILNSTTRNRPLSAPDITCCPTSNVHDLNISKPSGTCGAHWYFGLAIYRGLGPMRVYAFVSGIIIVAPYEREQERVLEGGGGARERGVDRYSEGRSNGWGREEDGGRRESEECCMPARAYV